MLGVKMCLKYCFPGRGFLWQTFSDADDLVRLGFESGLVRSHEQTQIGVFLLKATENVQGIVGTDACGGLLHHQQ